jgi:hypothetical protein
VRRERLEQGDPGAHHVTTSLSEERTVFEPPTGNCSVFA